MRVSTAEARDDTDTRTALQLQYTGAADYHGSLVADRIQDLQVAFTRTLQYDELESAASGTTQFNDALRMTVFAEVQKAIVRIRGKAEDLTFDTRERAEGQHSRARYRGVGSSS